MGIVETKKCHKSEPLICAFTHFVVQKPTTKVEIIVVCDVVLLFRKEVDDDKF
jgi:hypothetical protein